MRIALTGYARTGKDAVGIILHDIEPRFVRVAMGDHIKRQLDPLVHEQLGFSAFTEIDAEKKRIREVLVHWGYANYEKLLAALIDEARQHQFVVNTRIFRLEECRAWKAMGGLIWAVNRPGTSPAEPKEAEELQRIQSAKLIDATIYNTASLGWLHDQVTQAWLAAAASTTHSPA
jgi:hypothetical protein